MEEKKRTRPRALKYPDLVKESILSRTFRINYDQKLSSVAKLILNSFQKKYIYYAIDDIFYSLQSNPKERDNLLGILYSPIISLQNNFSIDFFSIWIDEIYIQEISKANKFLKNNSSNFQQQNCITLKLFYKMPKAIKKSSTLW